MKLLKLIIMAGLFGMFSLPFELPAQDWANLEKYREANKAVLQQKDPERIVFMGNSITEFWSSTDTSFFANKHYVNRGISGQTTPQMLIRFRPDVINLNPAKVVILAGINDIAGNTGPATIEEIAGNIFSMAEMAVANGIKPVICSVLPAADFYWNPGMEPAPKVIALNKLLKAYCEREKIQYVDYYSAMVDDKGGLKAAYGDDGVHPNLAGYKVMGDILVRTLQSADK